MITRQLEVHALRRCELTPRRGIWRQLAAGVSVLALIKRMLGIVLPMVLWVAASAVLFGIHALK